MVAGRMRLLTLAVLSVMLALVSSTAGFAQGQTEPRTVRDYCIKVAPGKGAEYEAFLRDVTLPLARARADAGEFNWFLVMSGVVPAGSSAPCDYRAVYGYKGLPPEAPSKEALAAGLKRAKLTMTVDDMVAKRNALTHLVGMDIWFGQDNLGQPAEKDNYIQLNHYNLKPGELDEWIRLEKTYWRALMEAWLKAGGKGSWSIDTLGWPRGESTPYNALTVDTFPDWNGLMQGVPVDQLWSKVHPSISPAEAFRRLDSVRTVRDVEVYKVVDVVRAK